MRPEGRCGVRERAPCRHDVVDEQHPSTDRARAGLPSEVGAFKTVHPGLPVLCTSVPADQRSTYCGTTGKLPSDQRGEVSWWLPTSGAEATATRRNWHNRVDRRLDRPRQRGGDRDQRCTTPDQLDLPNEFAPNVCVARQHDELVEPSGSRNLDSVEILGAGLTEASRRSAAENAGMVDGNRRVDPPPHRQHCHVLDHMAAV